MDKQTPATETDDGQSELTAELGSTLNITFRGNELIGFIWQIYALARIGDALEDWRISMGIPKDADPMEDQDAQDALLQGWANDLQALPVREDGTVEFTKGPWIVRPNV
jgi:hypothetical protein